MKRILFFFIAISTVFLSFSCRKTHKCTCTYTYTNGDYTTVAVAPSTKRDAQSWCNAIKESTAQPGVTTVCKLD